MPDTQARQDATMPDTHVGQDATMPDTHASEEAASSEPQGNGCAPLVDFDIQTATAAKGFGVCLKLSYCACWCTSEQLICTARRVMYVCIRKV